MEIIEKGNKLSCQQKKGRKRARGRQPIFSVCILTLVAKYFLLRNISRTLGMVEVYFKILESKYGMFDKKI